MDILEKSGWQFARGDILENYQKYFFLKNKFETLVESDLGFYRLFLRYVRTLSSNDQELTQADENSVLIQAVKTHYDSLNGVRVKSKAEKEIMDCLLCFKINGKPFDVKYEPDVCGFKPDFYVPNFDIYFEHWGLTKSGEVPEWFNQSTEEYLESMAFKKKWFAENKKTLIETFAYEYDTKNPEEFSDLLIERVKNKLEEKFPGQVFQFLYQEI